MLLVSFIATVFASTSFRQPIRPGTPSSFNVSSLDDYDQIRVHSLGYNNPLDVAMLLVRSSDLPDAFSLTSRNSIEIISDETELSRPDFSDTKSLPLGPNGNVIQYIRIDLPGLDSNDNPVYIRTWNRHGRKLTSVAGDAAAPDFYYPLEG
jgi:hypothetical protein